MINVYMHKYHYIFIFYIMNLIFIFIFYFILFFIIKKYKKINKEKSYNHMAESYYQSILLKTSYFHWKVSLLL